MDSIWINLGKVKTSEPQPTLIPGGFHMDYTGEGKDLRYICTVLCFAQVPDTPLFQVSPPDSVSHSS